MRNYLTIILVFSVLLLQQTAFAEGRLGQKVVDIIKSKHYLIRFSFIHYYDSWDKTAKEYYFTYGRDRRTETTLIQSGDNAMMLTEIYTREKLSKSNADLYTNNENYYWATKGNIKAVNTDYTPSKDVTVYHEIGALKGGAKTKIETSYASMITPFLPLLPETERYITLSTQATSNFTKGGLVFSKAGEEIIGDKLYRFEEYKTNRETNRQLCRFYFDNGKLVKYIEFFDSSYSLTEIKPGEKLAEDEKIVEQDFGGVRMKMKQKEIKGYVIMNIHELTSNFDETCLSEPKNNEMREFDQATMKTVKVQKAGNK